MDNAKRDAKSVHERANDVAFRVIKPAKPKGDGKKDGKSRNG